jgi:hypothetical protein
MKEKASRTSAALGTFLKSGCKCLFPYKRGQPRVGKWGSQEKERRIKIAKTHK